MDDQTFTVLLAQDLSPGQMSKQLADMARQVLDETDNYNASIIGRIPDSKTYVDGLEGAPLSSVRPLGQIAREYSLIPDAVPEIAAMLKASSPRLTGRYEASHVLFADGEEVEPDSEIPVAKTYVFASSVPYARKLERVNEVYGNVAREAARRFGNSVNIRLSFFSVSGIPETSDWLRTAKVTRRRRRNFVDWFTRQPAIIITVR